jgi:hypothetical protein
MQDARERDDLAKGRLGAVPDPALVLSSPLLDVTPFADRIANLAQRSGLDLSTTVFALRALPLAADRSRHADLRRAMAAALAPRLPLLRDRLPGIVAARLAPLGRPGRIDMMAGVITPCVGDVLTILSGVEVDADACTLVSRIFSEVLGPSRRLRLEAELRVLRHAIETAFPHGIGGRDRDAPCHGDPRAGCHDRDAGLQPARSHSDRVGPAFLGDVRSRCPAAHGRSLYRPRRDRRRRCRGATGDAGHAHARPSPRRYEDGGPAAAMGFFGAGAHLCLGRTPALDLWRVVAGELGTLPGTPRVVAFALRKDDVFAYPDRFIVEVS